MAYYHYRVLSRPKIAETFTKEDWQKFEKKLDEGCKKLTKKEDD